nr:MAG TPA: stabilization protein [Caudoviricetes sp.]
MATNSRQFQMQLNFNGGQVSENFTPRVDMQKYQTSCSVMRNFIPRQFGMLKRRPGFGFVDSFKNPFRILKFPCTNNEEYIVCVHSDNKYESGGCKPFATIYQCGYFGDQTRRWEVNLDIDPVFMPGVNGWTADSSSERHGRFWDTDLAKIKYVSQNDKMWIVHPDFFPLELTRTAKPAQLPQTSMAEDKYVVEFDTSSNTNLSTKNSLCFGLYGVNRLNAKTQPFFTLNFKDNKSIAFGFSGSGADTKWAITTSDGVVHQLENIGVSSDQTVDFSDFNKNIPINIYCFLTWRGNKLYASIGCNNSYGTLGLYKYSSSEVEVDSSLGNLLSFVIGGTPGSSTDAQSYVSFKETFSSGSDFSGIGIKVNFGQGDVPDKSFNNNDHRVSLIMAQMFGETSSVFKLNDCQIQQYNNSVFPIKRIYESGTNIYTEETVIDFKLTTMDFLTYPKSDDYYINNKNQSSNPDSPMFCRNHETYPDIPYYVYEDKDVALNTINAVFGDRFFLSDGSVSQIAGNDGTQIAEWLKDYTPGDVVIGSCLMNKTDGVLNGNIYNFSTGSNVGIPINFFRMANIVCRYVRGDWTLSTDAEVATSKGCLVSYIENNKVFSGYPNGGGYTIFRVNNNWFSQPRKLRMSGSDTPGVFIGLVYIGENGEVRTDTGDAEQSIEIDNSSGAYHTDIPFSVWPNQKRLTSTTTDATVFQNLTIMPLMYAPVLDVIFKNFSSNFGRGNYQITQTNISATNYYSAKFNDLVKCAFSVEKGYPSCIALRNGRLILASTKAQPQTIWASRVDRYNEFSVDDMADSGWDLTIGANQSQKIQWLSSSKDLIVGTDIGEWVLNDSDSSNPVPIIKEQSRWGSSVAQGELMTESLFFVPRDTKGVIQSIYSFQIDGYTSEDVTIMASDLFDSGITSHSIQKDPDPIWWGTTGDGRLLGLLYNRVQDINGWFQCDIQGAFINQVCCYNNPVKGEEGLIVSVKGKGENDFVNANQYFLSYMEDSNPCVDFFSTGQTSYTDALAYGGFVNNSWNNFSTGQTSYTDALNTLIVNGYFKENTNSSQLTVQAKTPTTQSWISRFSFSFDESAIFNNPVASGSDVEIESFLFENMYSPSQEVLTKGPFRMFVFDAETQELLTYSINSILLPDDTNQLPILEFSFLGLVLKANQKIRCYFSSASVPSWEGAEQILQLSVFDEAGHDVQYGYFPYMDVRVKATTSKIEWDETKPVYLDIISANGQTTTGYCFGGNEVNNNYSYYQQAPEGEGLFSQSQIVFNVKSEIENDIGQAGNSGFITPPSSTSSTLPNFVFGLHIFSEFISMPMGNANNYVIPATTTKISQLRYQVSRDEGNDVTPSSSFLSDDGLAYGAPRIQATVQALDYDAPIAMEKSTSMSVSTNLSNGRDHIVLSGQSSTDTRLYFSLDDAKKVNVLAAYILYDSTLVS